MRARIIVAAAGIVVLVAVGVVIGRATSQSAPPPEPPGLLQANNDTDGGPPAPGTRDATGSNDATGARLHVIVTPADGWLGIEVESATVPNGTRCRLFAYDHAGRAYEAGGWVQSAHPDFPLYAAVLMAPADLASVALVNEQGAKLVSAEIPPP